VSVRQVVIEKKLLPEERIDEALDVRAMTEPGLPE
jgi:aspartate ammonia-lyase